MVAMSPDTPFDEVLRELRARARALWGEERVAAIASSLEQTARQLWEVSRSLPQREVEPGFYQ
jgi:hypothetical protein